MGERNRFSSFEDEMIVEGVLDAVRKGMLIKDRYEELAAAMDRNAKSVQNRWQHVLKKRYLKEYKGLKEQKKHRNKEPMVVSPMAAAPSVDSPKDQESSSDITTDDIIAHLQHLKSENMQLKQELQEYKEYYDLSIAIHERSRKMMKFQDQLKDQNQASVSFRMDRNGNLERIENN
ncbi:hypothetical protein [Fictibacillus sp. NRS-1165]|uniref:hypothetical protein n=1 Tax=Fictibacillus sp. NRS-1165 TaxID=3144463 RepID=UPI003D250A40